MDGAQEILEGRTLIEDLRAVILQMLIDERVIEADAVDAMRDRLETEFVSETPLPELGWDSIQFAALLVRAEDRYGLDTSDLSVFDIFTVGDLVTAIEDRIGA